MTKFLYSGVFAACAVFMAGCAYNPAAIEATVAKDQASAQVALNQKQVPIPSLVVSDKPWVPLKKMGPHKAHVTAQTDVVKVGFNKRFSDLNDVSAAISSVTGFGVVIAQDVFSLVGTSAPTGAGATATTRTSLAITPAAALSINYSGNLTGLANYVASAYGISWQMDGQRIRFFRNESRTFRVVALPGDTHLSAQVGSSSTSGGGGGSAGGSSAVQAQSGNRSTGAAFSGLSVWKGLESTVKQMLSASGTVIASPSTGTMTVTDTPDVVASVSSFMREQNESLSRLVSVNVRVLSVQLKDGASRGINWDAVYDKINSSTALSLRTNFPGAGTLILTNRGDGPLNGTKAMIDALATQGRVSEVTSTQLVTMNNQPVPINVGMSRAYVASASITQAANVGSTSSITPGSIQTGFAMSLVPHIIDQQNVIMQYSMDISSLVDLESFASGGVTVQLPNVASNNFIQRVKLRSGETLVVAGFDQKDQSTSGQGLGNAQNAMAGSQSTKNNQTLMVVLIQPTIAN